MDSEKLMGLLVKGNTVLASVRKINNAMNTFRIISYVTLSLIVFLNVFGVINTLKQ